METAEGLPKSANSFVFYRINSSDYYTGRAPGPTPQWDYWNSIEISYNEDFIRFLRNKPL